MAPHLRHHKLNNAQSPAVVVGRLGWLGPPVEVCPEFELIAIENATARGDDVLEISKCPEAQMIGHMRHVRLPASWRFSLSASPVPENPLPTPSAGVRITR